MRIWIVTVADPIPSDHIRPMRVMQAANQAVSRGHDVTIWTTSFSHHLKRQRVHADTEQNIGPNYRVILLKSWEYRRNVSLQRYLAHRHFARRLSVAFRTAETRPDIVIATLPPLDTALTVTTFCLEKDIPAIVDVIDPWPDVFLNLVPYSVRPAAKLFLHPLYRQAKRIFSSAAAITAISRAYVDWGLEFRDDRNIPSWVFWPTVDMKSYLRDSEMRWKKLDTIYFVYAGAWGRSYDVETVIEAARLLNEQGEKRAHFEIAGAGPKAQTIQDMASGLSNVSLHGWLNEDDLLALLNRSHVGLAPYIKGATQTVTYKLFEYLAAGLPILCSLPGEMTDFIVEQKVGKFFEPGNAIKLAELVREILDSANLLQSTSYLARQVASKYGESRVVYLNMVQAWEAIATNHEDDSV